MNNRIFMDSFAWIAIINKTDNYHQFCIRLLNELLTQKNNLITTNYVLIETINALSKAEHRGAVIEFINRIENSPSVTIIKITDDLYESAWSLYRERTDKDWGIIDCTSFEVMKMLHVGKAFTNDRHFKQAGYLILVK